MIRFKKAQSTMEASIAFVAGSMVMTAGVLIFAWGIAHIPIRQVTYEATRITAAQPSRSVDSSGAQPTQKAATFPTYVVAAAE